MIRLKQVLLEMLLEEITERTTIYHRSPIKLNVGDTVKPKLTGKGNAHWLSEKKTEQALEQIRLQDFPDKPSRLQCVYSSLIPRSRFVDKGYLYVVKPVGKVHVTDSKIIDDYNERFDREWYERYYGSYGDEKTEYYEEYFKENPKQLASVGDYYGGRRYWSGVTPTKENIRDIEVLSDSAIVVEEIVDGNKTTPLRIGDEVVVTESGKLQAWMDLYINGEHYKNKENYTEEEFNQLIESIKNEVYDTGATIEDNFKNRHAKFKGTLKKGAKLIVRSIESSGTRETVQGKYNSIHFDFYVNGNPIYRLLEKNEKNIITELHVSHYLYYGVKEKVFDYSKYLRKVNG